MAVTLCTEEPLYKGHHWEPTFRPLQRGVPNSGASGTFPVGVVLYNWAVAHKHNVMRLTLQQLHFQSFPLLSAGREC